MNTTELKALADRCICRPARRGIADIMVAGKGLKFLAAQLEDAQGEIRALRATEAGLVDRVKELEKELNRKSEVFTPLDPWSVEQDYYGWLTTSSTTWDAYLAGVRLAESAHLKHAIDAHARALLEKKE